MRKVIYTLSVYFLLFIGLKPNELKSQAMLTAGIQTNDYVLFNLG